MRGLTRSEARLAPGQAGPSGRRSPWAERGISTRSHPSRCTPCRARCTSPRTAGQRYTACSMGRSVCQGMRLMGAVGICTPAWGLALRRDRCGQARRTARCLRTFDGTRPRRSGSRPRRSRRWHMACLARGSRRCPCLHGQWRTPDPHADRSWSQARHHRSALGWCHRRCNASHASRRYRTPHHLGRLELRKRGCSAQAPQLRHEGESVTWHLSEVRGGEMLTMSVGERGAPWCGVLWLLVAGLLARDAGSTARATFDAHLATAAPSTGAAALGSQRALITAHLALGLRSLFGELSFASSVGQVKDNVHSARFAMPRQLRPHQLGIYGCVGDGLGVLQLRSHSKHHGAEPLLKTLLRRFALLARPIFLHGLDILLVPRFVRALKLLGLLPQAVALGHQSALLLLPSLLILPPLLLIKCFALLMRLTLLASLLRLGHARRGHHRIREGGAAAQEQQQRCQGQCFQGVHAIPPGLNCNASAVLVRLSRQRLVCQWRWVGAARARAEEGV